jgi:hypothetical protein
MTSQESSVARMLRRLREWLESGEPPPNPQRPISHHFVPKVYLRQFAKPKLGGRKRRAQIVEIDLTSPHKRSQEKEVRNVCFQDHLYTIETADPAWSAMIEHVWGFIEGEIPGALLRVGSGIFPNTDDRELLSYFMALQYVRGPDTFDSLAEFGTQLTQAMADLLASDAEVIRNFLEATGRDASDVEVAAMQETYRNYDARVNPSDAMAMSAMLSGWLEGVKHFCFRHWVLVRSPIPLGTSDRPLILEPDHQTGMGADRMRRPEVA